MIQFCMFGAHEGHLRPDRRVFFTMFGGCELKRPTLARRILARRQGGATSLSAYRRQFVVTVFGGTEIKSPTLAEEFLDLRELVAGGALGLADWDRVLSELAQGEESQMVTVTLFGGFEESALPPENEEVDAIALQRHLGTISDRSGEILQLAIGTAGAQRRAAVHQAVAAAV